MARRTLPAAVVPEEAYLLLADYAHENRLTMSEAVRQMLQSAPPLKAYAKQRGVKLDFGVEPWRKPDGEGD